MVLQIKEAGISDVKYVAPLFNAYRIFYKQTSDRGRQPIFCMKEFPKKNQPFLLLLSMKKLLGLRNCTLFFHQCH